MQRQKLLYIMGIDWDWIYQRPQVLAEKLAQDYEVTTVFPRTILQAGKRKPADSVSPAEGCRYADDVSQTGECHFADGVSQAGKQKKLRHRILWTIPLQEKNNLIGAISRFLSKRVFQDIYDFDILYVSYPQYARYIPKDYKGMIIYDCLDNFEKLYPDQKRVYKVTREEIPLIKRCDLLLVSSSYLQKRADALAGEPKSRLLRNAAKYSEVRTQDRIRANIPDGAGAVQRWKAQDGIRANIPDGAEAVQRWEAQDRIREHIPDGAGAVQRGKIQDKTERSNLSQYHLAYIGTISEWMDYELMLQSIAQSGGIQYHLIGPAGKQVENPFISYEGVIAHEDLAAAIAEYDCLIMPFLLNEIVLAVDPVKLYEYISFGKCIISVYYPEVEPFRDFVYFYRTREEYMELLEELKQKGFPQKYSEEQQREFLQQNTWDNRYRQLLEYIREVETERK